MIEATPTKLKDGSWGARVWKAHVEVGDILTITTKAGKQWDAAVDEIVSGGGPGADLTIVRIVSLAGLRSRPVAKCEDCGSVDCYESDHGLLCDACVESRDRSAAASRSGKPSSECDECGDDEAVLIDIRDQPRLDKWDEASWVCQRCCDDRAA